MDRITFNSTERTERLTIRAPYYNAINPTTVAFAQEKVSVFVNSLGHVEFFDDEETSLGFVDIPVSKDPSEYGHTAQYGTVECSATGSTVTVHLPVYGWSDSYPNCDGESDRWSRYTSRWFRVVFDCEKRKIEILDRDS